MNEDLNRHEAELNEAELTGVSVGEKVDHQHAAIEASALCNNCLIMEPSEKLNCRHVSDLIAYIQANGLKSVPIRQKCPWYKS